MNHRIAIQDFAIAPFARYAQRMSEDPAEIALSRIEAALARLEGAAMQLPASDPTLAERHERLRGEVDASLHQLDELIARHRP